jgi:type IV pilus assembly protein PilY1
MIMKMKSTWIETLATASGKIRQALAMIAVLLIASGTANAQVAQTPLFLGGGNVPGNLTLVPSVEWPTITSVSSLGDYIQAKTYLGYFDPDKCYNYSYSLIEADRHFYPVRVASDRNCNDVLEWSGNFMNWAATQTIDPFRMVLTGGLRVKDTPTETWLEKACHTGQGGTNIYPDRRVPASGGDRDLVQASLPFRKNSVRLQIENLGNKMRFRINNNDTRDNDSNNSTNPPIIFDYEPGMTMNNQQPYEVSVRVKVCVPGLLEANCRQYSSGYKPEGVIQEHSKDLRIGVFGYANDPDQLRDGGILRARQKFVGPNMIVPGTGSVSNPNREWDPVTGVLVRNPDTADAAATATTLGIPIQDSGAINYLNKFGQMTNEPHKSKDPVGELYYTALRYLKNQGNVPEYSDIPGATGIAKTRAADGFPIITNWNDPIQYACQKNVLLGIGDVNTHRDKNLPGSTAGVDEPTMPELVSDDTSIDVVAETGAVAAMEGITINMANFSGRQNSAFMAGLAWDAHTRDMRPDLPGKQTASTHWVDVLEAQTLEPPIANQYYLTAKFGGFDVPEDFDPDTHTGPLDLDWWHTNGETLVSFGSNADVVGYNFPRPDNYYVAGEASQMVQSLTAAFANIAAEVRSSASAVAANSTRLGSDTAVYQAAFDSANWSGDLKAFRINADGTINPTAVWSAAGELDSLTETSLVNRNILTLTPPVAAGGGSFVSTTGIDFDWSSLTTSQQDALRQPFIPGPLVSLSQGQDRLAYLRGSRLLERPNGLLRKRDSRLGDISNSDPQLIGDQDFGYSLLDYSVAFTGGIGAAYTTYRNSAAYQSRPPVLIVGANDGMLHAFNAELTSSGGEELFAFIPQSVFDNLYELTLPEYSHRFYVDSAPRFADAYFNSSWHSVAVGATGAGGKSVFALDVTDPTSMNPSDVLWEFSHPSMGYTIGQPAIVPLPNGKFGAVVTSGYETGQTDGTIWILDVEDGSIIQTFTTPNSGDLGAPLVVDIDGDRVADRVYAGDTQGNLWRFDLVGSNTSNWEAPASLLSGGNAVPLFVARDSNGLRQAITAPLASAFNEDGLHTIFFGTGSFYRTNDNVVPTNPDVDTFYAVIDRGVSFSGRTTLLEQSILAEVTAHGFGVRAVTANVLDYSHDGWYLDLQWKSAFGGPGPIGERVVSRATVRGDRVIFATVIPDRDPCSFGGDSWIMELNSFNGGRLDYAVFDLDADGEFNDDDWITVIDENGDEIRVPASGIDPDIGIVKTPAVITGVGDNNDEVKVLSGSSGELIRISERGGIDVGRQSWRQLR